VDKRGYELIKDQSPKLKPGYSLEDVFDQLDKYPPAKIVGLGGPKIRKRLDDYPALYAEFADVRTPDDLLKFITQYGPLTQRTIEMSVVGKWEGDIVPYILQEAEQLRSECKSRAAKKKVILNPINCKAYLSADLTFTYSPVILLDAIWLQFGQSLSEGAEMRKCRLCGRLFPVGGQSGKRSVALFCREEHQVKWNSRERSKKS
jgi:hypothetical protein